MFPAIFPSISVAILSALALSNALTAFVVLYFMQAVTAGSGFHSRLAFLQLIQRGVYIVLAFALMKNAIHIYFDGIMPAFGDGLVETAFFLASLVSFLRHRLAPPIPASAPWRSRSPA